MFLISLCFLVALKNIIKYKEQSVLLTMSCLLINNFLKNFVYSIGTENETDSTVVVC